MLPHPRQRGNRKPFAPPSIERLRRYLDRHPPVAPSRAVVMMPLLVLGVILVLTLVFPHPLVLVLPWVALGGLLVSMVLRSRRMAGLEHRVNQIQELTMLRRHRDALRLAWRLLPALSATPELHGRTVAFLAYNLDRLAAYEQAVAAYGYLIERLPDDHPGSVQIRIQRAMAQLSNDELTSADDTLRGLRGVIEDFRDTAIAATFRLARLFQQVRTRHYSDAVESAPTLVDDLRPLGIEAGYGHALMAWSHYARSQGEAAAPDDYERARHWWSRATLLVSAPLLVERYNDLAALAEALGPTPPTEPPQG